MGSKGDSRSESVCFGAQLVDFEEKKRDFQVKWGIFQEKMCDFRVKGVFLRRENARHSVKWRVFVVKMRGFQVKAGFVKEKMHDFWIECFFFF